MDFVVGLPKTLGKFDSIWVIVDRLTKSAHFIPVKVTYNAEKLSQTLHLGSGAIAWGSTLHYIR